MIQTLIAGKKKHLFRMKEKKQYSSKVLANFFTHQSWYEGPLGHECFEGKISPCALSLPHLIVQSVKTVVFSLLLIFFLTYASLYTI